MNNIRSLSALFLLSVLISCKDDDEDVWPQLLANADIEQGSAAPNGWVTNENDGSGLDFVWTDQEASSGSRSLQILKSNDDDTEVWGFWAQIYEGDIPHGQDIELSVMIKGNDIQGQGISIAIRADREDLPGSESQFATTQGVIPIDGTFDWRNERLVLNDLEPDVNSILIFLLYLPETTGEVFFDDVALTVVE